MTLAPELPNIEPIIDFCRTHGILLQAGHTNATYEEFSLGAVRGVTHATHLFNAMSPFTQRAPGASGAVLMNPGISCEIIADGVHVHPDIVSFLRTVKPVENIVLVTDALRPTGQQKGPFIANGEEVILNGGVWKRKTDGVIAGSALTMARGVKNLVDFGYTLPQAGLCASANPARLLGLAHTGRLETGCTADIVLLGADFRPVKTFIQGKEI
jgi:N-acetylglucosamine-6-phosphate deacetylase